MATLSQEFRYWSLEPVELAAQLETTPDGLSNAAAAQRLLTAGPNSVEPSSRSSGLRLLLRQFESPLVLILLVAAVLSMLLKEWIDAAIILAILLGSSILSFYQEYRASAAVEALKKRLSLTCRVVREGREAIVPAQDVVPGDLIQLSAGNLIPADGVVLEAQDFLVTESAMTGESFPVEKRPGSVAATAPITQRTNTVFLGSSVRSGTARVLAVRTGPNTEFGAIAQRLRSREPETGFSRGVRDFGYLLIRVMVVIVIFVLSLNVLLDRPVVESLLFAVALAVGLSPELLPAIISVTLSGGARAMSARGVIVRRLSAIETLGSMDILCTDKTGTLTEGSVVLQDVVDADDAASDKVRLLAFINASFETGIANPLDAAILAGCTGLSTDGLTKIDEIPYDFTRRRLTIVVADAADSGRHLLVTKGAVSSILEICSQVERGDSEIALNSERREALERTFSAKSAEGFRVLAVASRKVPIKADYVRTDESEMTFRGFLVFFDPPKADAQRTIRDLERLGIRTKIISGDNRHVTAHLARSVGLDASSMLTGEEIAALRDEALWHRAPRTDLFVEIDPQQKERIVRALQRAGHSVGFLGDGINDAPALHAADVGISVDQAVDVARESADIILLNRDLDVLRSGVEDGRRTFANTLKYISITTSANFGNMVSMAIATPFLPFLPLVAKQILLNNFLSDLPSVAISTDAVDPELVARPQAWSTRGIRNFMIVFGLISSLFDLLTFALLLYVFHAGEAVFQTSWFVISLLTELVVVLLLRTRRAAWRSAPSRLLLVSTIVIAGVALGLPYAGPVSDIFGFVTLSGSEMAVIVCIVAGYLLATEIAKRWYWRQLVKRRAGGAILPVR